jgi:predicted nuclease of restriction endonuclease-like (RecB) superfamily
MAKKTDKERKSLAEIDGVIFPVAPLATAMDARYFEMRDFVISEIQQTRVHFIMQANAEKNLLNWRIGNEILRRQREQGWGAGVIDRLSKDIAEAFPDMEGYSSRNLGNMKRFAELCRDESILQRGVAKLPWRSIVLLLDKVKDEKERIWYAEQSLSQGWSSNVLGLMVGGKLVERQGKATNNFTVALPPVDSDMAVEVFKDPYVFDFLGTDATRREIEVERALTAQIEKFLLELGQGFAFVGRQVHLEVGGDDFYIDLLFYHLKLRCYVVIELKACDFEPGFASQLSMYQNIVDRALRHPDDKPTIGLLLVKGKNKTVVEYSISSIKNPIGVADWQERLTAVLPDDLKSSLPTIEEIEKELAIDVGKSKKDNKAD